LLIYLQEPEGTLFVKNNFTLAEKGSIAGYGTLAVGSAQEYANMALISGKVTIGKIEIFANTIFVDAQGELSTNFFAPGLGDGGANVTNSFTGSGAHGGSGAGDTPSLVGFPYDSYSSPSLPGSLGSGGTGGMYLAFYYFFLYLCFSFLFFPFLLGEANVKMETRGIAQGAWVTPTSLIIYLLSIPSLPSSSSSSLY
jgi:hypothetical protein